MTPKQEAALRQAREALEYQIKPLCMCFAGCENCDPTKAPDIESAITAIDEALAEQQEPVAQVDYNERGNIRWLFGKQVPDKELLYTSPPASKPWRGLTDEELADIAMQSGAYDGQLRDFVRAIEAKLRELNEHKEKNA